MQFQIHLIRTYLKRFDGKRRHLLRQAGAGGDPPCRQIGGKTGQPFNRVREHGKRELRIILIAALALTNMRQKEPAADVFHPVPRALRLLVREENLRQIGIALDIQRRRPGISGPLVDLFQQPVIALPRFGQQLHRHKKAGFRPSEPLGRSLPAPVFPALLIDPEHVAIPLRRKAPHIIEIGFQLRSALEVTTRLLPLSQGFQQCAEGDQCLIKSRNAVARFRKRPATLVIAC